MRRSLAHRLVVAALLVQLALTAALIYRSAGFEPWIAELRRGGEEAVAGAGTMVLLIILIAPVVRGWKWAIVAVTLVQALLIGGILPFFLESFARPGELRQWLLNTTYLLVGTGAILFGTIAAAESFGRSAPAGFRAERGVSWQGALAAVLAASWIGMMAVAAAASSAGGGQGSHPGVADGVISLPMHGVRFLHDPLRITAGARIAVVLVNRDAFEHSFDVDSLGIHVAVPALSTGMAFLPPQRPGRIPFYCRVAGHTEAGMTGTIVVE